MKVIGLIGGMTWKSTSVYYQLLNEITNEKLGGRHSCECILYSVDFDEIERLQHRGDWQQLADIMSKAAGKLEKAGADMIVICANTMHKTADEIEDRVNIPVVHIADAVAVEVKEQNLQKIGLIGTKFIMEHDFYKNRIKKTFDIDVISPKGRDMITIHRIIFDELIYGTVKEESKKRYLEIINKLTERGAEGIILGCTEISILLNQSDINIPIFDTIRIHVEKAVEFAIA
ncbi:MAG: aspartate/glutamate racemase family protein [Bacteroidales bacterium]|nr:aspartate/glutamate racemase family protein [Bacteroidales bacterium]